MPSSTKFPPAKSGSALNILIPDLGFDESTCRRQFGRHIERAMPGSTIDSESLSPRTAVILSGWACEMRILMDGRRQIFTFLTPGDVIDIFPRGAARSVLALTRVETVGTEAIRLSSQTVDKPGLSAAILGSQSRRHGRIYDHVVRLGQLNAYERTVHLLLELHERLDAVGLAKAGSFRIPITQEHLADALGLSLVHVNRTVQQLRADRLIELRGGAVTLSKLSKLMSLVDFEASIAPAIRVQVGAGRLDTQQRLQQLS